MWIWSIRSLQAFSSADPLPCPSRRQGSCLLSSSPQETPPFTMTFQKLLTASLQWHQPATSAHVAASHHGPWTFVHPVCFSIPWPAPSPPRVSLPSLVSRTWDCWRLVLSAKTEAKKVFITWAISLALVTVPPFPFSCRPAFSRTFSQNL